MISKEEIKKLAELARLDIEGQEIESLRGDMDSILAYLDQVKSIVGGEGSLNSPIVVKGEYGGVVNIMREDESASWRTTESETYSKELIAEFPNKEGNYLKVKKIL